MSTEQYKALLANMQALLNIAEVKAPGLQFDAQWQALRAHHTEELKALGVDQWINERAEEYRQRIEGAE